VCSTSHLGGASDQTVLTAKRAIAASRVTIAAPSSRAWALPFLQSRRVRPSNREAMAASRFCRYELRTTDVNAAQAFYADVVGAQLWGSDVSLAPLPERAAAQGAPAHWLGHIGVRDVEATAGRVVALGGQQLGPLQRGTDGSSHAVLRDPFGAVMAVSCETVALRGAPVAWHLLHTQDHERAFALYAALFGWTATEGLDLGPEMGCHQGFAWDESGQNMGSVANTARLPHIHPHWLFFFRVADIEDSLARVRARGGNVLGPMRAWSGDLVAPCVDPQGAAFALYRSRTGLRVA
jgi:predicted enzyme related to lactoylglutathione lyase